MYYPKSQIIENLYTNGDEYMVESNNLPYKGYYYRISNGNLFTGRNTLDLPNASLVSISANTNFSSDLDDPKEQPPIWSASYSYIQRIKGNTLPQPAISPKQTIPLPTSNNYKDGFFNRYFLYKSSNKSTIETDENTYNSFNAESPNTQFERYVTLTLVWSLVGNNRDAYNANYNNVRLLEQNQKVYGFSNYFVNKYTQYFQYSKGENLYSNGKEVKDKKTGKPYVGYYHIHPTKGPMVGRQHTIEAHDYLELSPTGSTTNPIPPTIQSGSYEEPSKTITNTFGGY